MISKLSLASLASLDPDVAIPQYARNALTPGIMHIGVGNFHRAHQAVYLDRLFSLGADHDWAIVGAGIKPYDAVQRRALAAQDWLTTVVELDPKGYSARVTGAMVDYVEVDAQAIITRLTDPAIRIVSMTVTEGGYYIDARSGGFDVAHPDIVADAAAPASPRTVFGILLEGLVRRRALGRAPFTILSCDNLPENGHVARNAVVGLARLVSSDLATWVDENVAFPCCMVDCITPATSDRERALVRDHFGIDDAVPVVCEPFRQWVMEDNFPLGRPRLERVGVEFVDDVAPYEAMKLRILNAGHAAIAYPSALLGFDYVHDAMADPDIKAWLDALETRELIPTIDPIPGKDFHAYLAACAARFSNPAIGDTIPRLCLDGSNRQPKFILPSLAVALERGLPIDGIALELAFWCRYCALGATADSGIELVDERAAELAQAAGAAMGDPARFLGLREIFGDLATSDRLLRAFGDQLGLIGETGARRALQRYLGAIPG